MEPNQERLIQVFSRTTPIDALGALVQAIAREPAPDIDFARSAVCLDSNVLLNVAKGRGVTDLVDYIASRHEAPVIVPSQSIQEFWNNQVSAVFGLADKVRKEFGDLCGTVRQIDPAFDGFKSSLESLLQTFEDNYGHVLDERMSGDINSLLGSLATRGLCPQMPRNLLGEIARQRKLTRTPPGFKDDGDGDFYIWADMLYGLLNAKDSGATFSSIILVTDDVKKDWSTKGTPNPILSAEVKSLFNVPFRTWKLQQFSDAVKNEIG